VTGRRLIGPLAAVAVLAAAGGAGAHELDHAVTRGSAVVVEFRFPDGTPFSYESFEVTPPAEETPFAVGRTDALGRVVFLPDREGDWRVRVFSEDGHGADIVVPASPAEMGEGGAPAGAAAAGAVAGTSRASRIALGIGIILGAFGIIGMTRGRSRKT
jgi:nickel transport protein